MAYDWAIKDLQQSGQKTSAPAKTVSKTSTPVYSAPQQSFSQKAAGAYVGAVKTGLKVATAPVRSQVAGLGTLGKVLSAPLYGFGGFLRGTRAEAEKQAPQVKSGKKNLLPALGTSFAAGVKNIPTGVKQQTTPGDYLTEDVLKTKNKYAKAGIGLATDIAADPLNLVGLGVVNKFAKSAKLPEVASKVTEVASKVPGYQKARDAAGAFQYGYKTPENFLRKYEATQSNITTKAVERAKKIAYGLKYDEKGKELPKETQRVIGDLLNLKGTEPSVKSMTPEELALQKQYGPIVDKTLKEFGKLAQEQIKLGADPSIFEKLLGKYYGKRMFENLPKPQINQFTSPKSGRLDLSVYKNRKDLPPEILKQLGEIKEPAQGAATAAFAEKRNIELNKFYRWVAKKYVNQGENLVDLPKTERLGVLSGRKVPKQIADYIDVISSGGDNTAFEKIIKVFKKGKTIWSPKQLARNVVTSQVQAFMNPEGSATSFRRIPEAIKEIRTKGKYYKELVNTGEIGGTFPGAELDQFAANFGKKNILKKASALGSNIQQINEEVAKLQVFINERKAGKTVEMARKAAEKSQFNYQKVSPLVNRLRTGKQKLGPLPFSIPFLTYPLKAAELTARTAIKHPERLTGMIKGEKAVQQLSTAPNEQYLPDYLKDSVRLPVKNKKTGNNYYLNAKYTYPYGNLGEISPLPLGLTPDPIYQELISQTMGKDVFTGANIPDSLTPGGVAGRARHAAETFLPGPVRSGLKVADTMLKNKTLSTSPSTKQAIAQELGLPIYQYSPAEGARFASYDKRNAIIKAKSDYKSFIQKYSNSPLQKNFPAVYDTLKKKKLDNILKASK